MSRIFSGVIQFRITGESAEAELHSFLAQNLKPILKGEGWMPQVVMILAWFRNLSRV